MPEVRKVWSKKLNWIQPAISFPPHAAAAESIDKLQQVSPLTAELFIRYNPFNPPPFASSRQQQLRGKTCKSFKFITDTSNARQFDVQKSSSWTYFTGISKQKKNFPGRAQNILIDLL